MTKKDNQILCCPWSQEPHRIDNCQYHCCNCDELLGIVKTATIQVEEDIFWLCQTCLKSFRKLQTTNQNE